MKRQRYDPVTGDPLTTGEYVSWIIQSIIRRWTFLGLILTVTIIVWTTDNPAALNWWNLNASLLAIMIESVVGMAMFGQTRRDAMVIREIRANGQQNMLILQEMRAMMQEMREMLREVRAIGQEVERLAEKIEGEESQEVAELVKIEKRLEGVRHE